MRFFRGYLYTDLLKRYKEVIIYDENLDNIKKDMPVSSEADGWNFVYNDLKYAGEHLPVDKTPNGRLTSGAAYAHFLCRGTESSGHGIAVERFITSRNHISIKVMSHSGTLIITIL